jgi:hypothetical protein
MGPDRPQALRTAQPRPGQGRTAGRDTGYAEPDPQGANRRLGRDEIDREAAASCLTVPELIRCALRQRLWPGSLAVWSAMALALAATGCGSRYEWAFAENLDGSLPPGGICGQSLADALYSEPSRERFRREGNSNVYVFSGGVEQYRVYAYVTQRECETARTGLMEQRGR